MKSIETSESIILGIANRTARRLIALVVVAISFLGIAAPARASVLFNEIMYHPVTDDDREEFLELYNTSASAVALENWCVDGISFCFGPGATIAGNGYLILAKDAAFFQAKYGFAPNHTYTGTLSNGGERLRLLNATQQVIDQVEYDDMGLWTPRPDGEGPSLERIDPTLNGDTARNWAACTNPAGHTAAALNSVNAVGLPPWITEAQHTQNVLPSQSVEVTARVVDATTVTLTYKIDFAPDVTIDMYDDGAHNDGAAADGIYGATIPGQPANSLIRYRIVASGLLATMRHPRVDDTINYVGTVVVDSSIVTSLPVFNWFMDPVDYQHALDHKFTDLTEPAIFAYGDEIWDNVQVRVRGQSSRSWPKNHWKFYLPQGHDFFWPGLIAIPVDQFNLQGSYSDKSYVREILSYETFRDAGHPSNQYFPVRLHQNGTFYGLYSFLESMDDDYITRNGLSETAAWYKADDDCRFRTLAELPNEYEKEQRELDDYSDLYALLDGVNNLSGAARQNFLFDNVNIPNLINYLAAQCIVHNNDHLAKNYFLYRDTDGTGRWTMHTWDMDLTFGRNFGAGGGVLSDGIWADDDAPHPTNPFVSPSHPLFGDSNHRKWDNITNYFIEAMYENQQIRAMYFRRLRTLCDLLLPAGRYEDRIDEVVALIAPEAAMDVVKWGQYGVPQTLSEAVNILKNDYLAVRRVHLLTTHRIPGEIPAAQSPTPTIIINEIMYRSSGDEALAEYVELYNPSTTESVDVSGWRLEGVALSLPVGLVILPNSFTVVVRNDVGFRGVYGSGKFIGAQYSGELANGGERITLRDQTGRLVDEVHYESVAPWPTGANGGGMSLERIDPARPGSLPSNWAASLAIGGTPCAANSQAGTLGALPSVMINEVLPVNTAVNQDDQNEFAPWIELYNPTSSTISLAGLYLTNNYGLPLMWAFSPGTQLCANERLLVWADNQPAQGPLHANFAISSAGGSVGLYSSAGVLIDYMNYPALAANRSYGRYPDGTSSRVALSLPTPLAANYAATVPMVLNEYNAVSPTNFIKNSASDSFFGRIVGNGGDWFELVVTQNHLDVRGWQLVALDNPGPSQTIHTLTFTNDAIWSDLRAGTIITVCESVADDISYDPLGGDWWINVRSGPSGTGAYITAVDFEVDQRNWQLTIKNADGLTVFGPAGEGVMPASGIGSDEVFKLEADPSEFTTPTSNYNDGSSSTFGSPNLFNSGTQSQNFIPLRSLVFPCNTNGECADDDPCTSDTCVNGECYHTIVSPCHRLSLDVVGGAQRCAGPMDVKLNLTGIPAPLNGAQVLLRYDPTRLALQSITPGDSAGSPWDPAMTIAFTDVGGAVTYALALFGGSASVDATVATLHFIVLNPGMATDLIRVEFDPPASCSPIRTKLTTVLSETRLPTTVDSDFISVGPRLDVSLDVEGLNQPVTRDVTFVLTTCDGLVTETITNPVSFDANGLGNVALVGISPLASWVSIREGHTLRKLMPLGYSSCHAAVNCTGTDRLIAGDFQTSGIPQDNLVDVLDFAILAGRWGTTVGDCVSGLPANCGLGADVNGDGVQETADFQAIQINFLKIGDGPHACSVLVPAQPKRQPLAGASGDPTVISELPDALTAPQSSISIQSSVLRSVSSNADVDGNGLIDLKDIREFARQRGIPLLAEFEQRIAAYEASTASAVAPARMPRRTIAP